MAARSSAEVDYLETVHPLNYPVFQSLLSNQFATRRRLPTPAKPFASDSPSNPKGGSSATVQMTDFGWVEMSVSRSDVSMTDQHVSSSGNSSVYDLSTIFGADEKMNYSANVSSTTNNPNESATSYGPQPSTSSEPPASCTSPTYRLVQPDRITDNPTRSLEAGKKRRLKKEKTVSFAGFRRAMNPHRAVCGSFHQASLNRGLSVFRGSQCTSIGLAAIMTSKSLPVHTWIPSDIDSIIRSGDKLHETLMSDLGRTPNEGHLQMDDIQSSRDFQFTIPAPLPDVANWSENNLICLKMSMRKSQIFRGHLTTNCKSNHNGDVGIHDALCRIFDQGFDGALLQIGDSKGTVLRDLKGRVRYFDSHNNNKYGRLSRNGTAILLRFSTVRCFVQHMKRKEIRGCRFQAVGISFRVQERIAVGLY